MSTGIAFKARLLAEGIRPANDATGGDNDARKRNEHKKTLYHG